MKSFLMIFLVCAFLFENAFTLVCYQCSNVGHPSNTTCSDGSFTDLTTTTCSSSNELATACTKTVYVRSNGTTYARGCSGFGTCNSLTCTGSNSYSFSTYFCTTDRCNSGDNIQIRLSTIFLAILSSLISYKIFF